VIPLDVETVLALDSLPDSFHGDPADRLIVATARAHGLPLAIRDTRIRRARVARLWKPGQGS
jgi:PIN domain nuclease of toxin-antitoxin system